MTMQHKRSDFHGLVSEAGVIKLNKIADEKRIRITGLSMASKRIADEYPEMAGWYCLRVKGGREFSVENSMKDVGIDAIVPCRKGEEMRKRGRIIAAPMLPVIPGYVLIRIVPSAAALSAVRRIDNVSGFVGKGEVAYRVPAKYINRFMSLAVTGEYDYRVTETTLKAGSKVRISDGPFASFPAVVTGIEGAKVGRIDVEVNIFGRLTPIELDLAQVEEL